MSLINRGRWFISFFLSMIFVSMLRKNLKRSGNLFYSTRKAVVKCPDIQVIVSGRTISASGWGKRNSIKGMWIFLKSRFKFSQTGFAEGVFIKGLNLLQNSDEAGNCLDYFRNGIVYKIGFSIWIQHVNHPVKLIQQEKETSLHSTAIYVKRLW